MLFLKRFNLDDLDAEYEFVRDMPGDENGMTNSFSGVSRAEFEKAVPRILANEKGEALSPGYVPESFYYLWKDDEIVGQFRIRHYLNDSLRTGSGHIGYFIKKCCRGRGYAKEGLRLALEIAAQIVPEDEFYLRVNRDNPASLQVMLANGGRIHAQDERCYFVRIPKP